MKMKYTEQFEKIKKLIDRNQQFVLLSHIYTDGDALGSLLAFYYFLKNEGKEVSVYIPGDIPEKYHFLNFSGIVNSGPLDEHKTVLKNAQVIFILDISDLKRLDVYHDAVKESVAQRVIIDHHPLNQEWTEISICDTDRIATSEMIYELFKFLNAPIDLKMATALYTALLSDSGSFRFYKTSADSFRMAAELVQIGAEPSEIYSHVFETARTDQLKAWGILLSNLQKGPECTWLIVSNKFLLENKLELHEIDGLIDIIRKDQQANAFALFVEKETNEILVGLRSRDGVDVGLIARSFGGGGHYHASGFTSTKNLQETVEHTINKITSFKIQESA